MGETVRREEKAECWNHIKKEIFKNHKSRERNERKEGRRGGRRRKKEKRKQVTVDEIKGREEMMEPRSTKFKVNTRQSGRTKGKAL